MKLFSTISFALLTVYAITFSDCARNPLTPTVHNRKTPLTIIAHRGASYAAPENTIPAFQLAIDEGADYIEGDFRLTKDNQIVSVHDSSTKRVAPSSEPILIGQATLKDLKALDVGSWKNKKYKGTRIPTLHEVINLLKTSSPTIGLYIEIKDKRPTIIEHIKRTIGPLNLSHLNIKIISFKSQIISTSKKEMPNIETYWLYSWDPLKNKYQKKYSQNKIIEIATKINADGVGINSTYPITRNFIHKLKQANLKLHVYTIDDPSVAIQYYKLGVDTITTNQPKRLRKKLMQHYQNDSKRKSGPGFRTIPRRS